MFILLILMASILYLQKQHYKERTRLPYIISRYFFGANPVKLLIHRGMVGGYGVKMQRAALG